MSGDKIVRLRELVRTMNDGVEFYQAACLKVEHESYKEVFKRMAETHKFAIDYLQPYVVMQTGAPEEGHTFGGPLHQIYADLLATMNRDHDQTLILQLEALEEQTLAIMEQTAKESGSTLIKMVIEELHPRLMQCREEMIALDKSNRRDVASLH